MTVKTINGKSPQEAALSVTQLNRRAKRLLEQGLARLWVEGEISNIAKPASGHVYFSLKDDNAQVRAAFFRQRQRGPTLGLKNGDRVLAFGRVSLYEPRGDYQLIVEQVEPAGEGALKREFDRLKRKLAAEGLFDEAQKQSLPRLPRRIGVITSPTGAAVRDILTILQRRFASVPVVIYPAAVQGSAAPAELQQALATAIRRDECDVLIMGRGGGSLEDLWAFNDEALARAIAASPIPVVSAVGHEVDFTIADFVADVRAPTPSGAAELVVPDRNEWLLALQQLERRLVRGGRRLLEEQAQTLDWCIRRMINAVRYELVAGNSRLQKLHARLSAQAPALRIERLHGRQQALASRLVTAMQQRQENCQHRLNIAARALQSVSPLATLTRGYAIVEDADSGRVLTDAGTVKTGSRVRARLSSGELLAEVTDVKS